MYDIFLRMVREELESARITTIPSSKISDYKSYIKNLFSQIPVLDESSRKYLGLVFTNVITDLDTFVRIRLVKAILGSELPRETADKILLEIVPKIVDLAKKIYSGFFVEYEGKPIVIFKHNCYHRGREYVSGDITIVDQGDAMTLYLSGCIDFIPQPYLKEFLTREQ
ncbi:MAG: hypothetical protein DRO13_04465 [Thermoprotei archaeon]|nr:MAG: hypothetical protein DRO13_04465 [Thermoprotei archaeon]